MSSPRVPSTPEAAASDETRAAGGRTRRLTAASLTIPRSEELPRHGVMIAPVEEAPRPSRRGIDAGYAAAAAERPDLPGVLWVVGLCFSGLAVFGGDRAELALMLDAFWGVAILAVLWRRPLRFNLFQVRSLLILSVVFAALVAWIALSLTAIIPAPAGSSWTWVGDRAGTIDRAMTVVELTKLVGLGAAFWAGLLIADTDRRAELTMRCLCTAGALFAIFALVQHVVTPSRVLGAAKVLFQDRLTGTFLSANVASGFFGGLALLNLAALDAGPQVHASRIQGDVHFITRYGALVLLFACLVLTASRTGAISVMAGLAVSVGLEFWKERKSSVSLRSKATLRLMVFGVFLVLASAGQLLISRFNETDSGLSGRNVVFSEHLRAFLASPFTGYGLGSFSTINDQLVTPETFFAMWNIRAAHNVYLQWFEETGVVGATLMFAVIAIIHWEIFQGLRSRQSMLWLMRGVVGFSVVLIVQGFGDFTLQTPAVALMWALVLGVAYRVATGGSRAVEREAGSPSAQVRIAAAWGPVCLAVCAELSALVVLWGAGRKAAEDHFPLALRTAYEMSAVNRLNSRAPSGKADAKADALAALRQDPTDAYAWTMLAYIQGNSATGRDALVKSYLSAPLAPNLVRWRAEMVADWWNDLTPDVRAQAMQELRAERKLEGFDMWLKALLATRRNTPFGLALSLALQNWGSNTD